MAAIDTGSKSAGSRELNRELPLIPFIDFLLCLISFLLITAIWTQNARLDASALVPGHHDESDRPPPKELHVQINDAAFDLRWTQGGTVLSTSSVARRALKVNENVRYPDLEQRLLEEWQSNGMHRSAADLDADQAVVHTGNRTEFGELSAVIDALHGPRRAITLGGATHQVPAFRVSFAAN